MFTDTHAHLDYPDYANDLEQVVSRAGEAGVRKIITIGIGRESIPAALALAERFENVRAAVGVHPTDLDALTSNEWEVLEKAARHPKVVGIGETGLDYHHLPSEKEPGRDDLDAENKRHQEEYFRRQLELSKAAGKPVIVHCRDAYADTLKILEEFGRFRDHCGVLHCFGGSAEDAKRAYGLGYVISVGGVLTFKNAATLREIVAAAPRDRVLLETDCPFLAPTPHRGKRNEPAYARLVAEKLAEIWSCGLDEVSRITEANVKALFGI